MTTPFESSVEHLLVELAELDAALGAEVERFRGQGLDRKDPLRLAFVSDSEVDRLLGQGPALSSTEESSTSTTSAYDSKAARAAIEARMVATVTRGVRLGLVELSQIFSLTSLESRILVLALAPEIDLKYERIFGYLQDDLSRKRPSLDLALRVLCPTSSARLDALRALARGSALFRSGLLATSPIGDVPWLATPLRLDHQVVSFLIEGVVPTDDGVSVYRNESGASLDTLRWPASTKQRLLELVSEHIGADSRRVVCELVGPRGTGRKALAGAVCAELGVALAVVDLRVLLREPAEFEARLRAAFRRGLLAQAPVYFEHFELLLGSEAEVAGATFARCLDEMSWLTFLGSTDGGVFSERFPNHTFVRLRLAPPDIGERERLWQELSRDGAPFASDVDWTELAAKFRLTPGGIRSALRAACDMAQLRGKEELVTHGDLVASCAGQSSKKLSSLAKQLPANHVWDDLIVPPQALAQLAEICAQMKHRRRVYEDWGFGRMHTSSRGICALFYGPSGVGKTLGADVIAHELGLDAYRIDLSAVVSKYIGETEKNLSRLFEEAETANAILFFDEADALFGKRSEVKDAHDRYANIETNYLLQRMEDFDGLVILASNLRKNIDDSFFRRMHFAVEFTMPDVAHRYRIWRHHLPRAAPIGSSVDIDFLATRFPIPGGSIRNIVLSAAFLAAEDGDSIDMSHLIRATRREYEKLGRPCTPGEFAPYQEVLLQP